MTREEAITILETLWNNPLFNDSHKEALNIAIEALEHPKKNVISIVPCGDAISRQAVLDIITFEDKWLFDANGHNANTRIAFSGLESRVKDLPSVTPQQKVGRWIPVSERLPEERGDYLVTQKATFTDYVYISVTGYAHNLYDVDEYDFADKKRPGWYEYDSEWGYREFDNVIAWMPLPEPYKAESEK